MVESLMLENKLKLNNDKRGHPPALIFQVLFSLQTYYHLCLWLWNIFFFFCQKSWFLHQRWHERGTSHKEHLPIGLLWTPPYQHNSASSFSWLQKHVCPSLSSLGLIIVTRSSQAALNIFLKNYKRSKTQLQDLSKKLINKIMFQPFSELFTGCSSKHPSTYRI